MSLDRHGADYMHCSPEENQEFAPMANEFRVPDMRILFSAPIVSSRSGPTGILDF